MRNLLFILAYLIFITTTGGLALSNSADIGMNAEVRELGSSEKVSKDKSYTIEIVYLGNVTQEIQDAVNNAKAKWESIIISDIPKSITLPKNTKCVMSETQLPEDKLIDDLLIFVIEKAIDGPGVSGGVFGPCLASKSPKYYSRVGLIAFDVDDVAFLKENNLINTLVNQGFATSIGISTFWEYYKLVPKYTTPDPTAFYKGKNGIKGLKAIGGKGKPIVVKAGGANTPYLFWDPSSYPNELMSRGVGANFTISKLTVLSFQDIGFKVDESKADEYTIPPKIQESNLDDTPKLDLDFEFIQNPIVIDGVDSN